MKLHLLFLAAFSVAVCHGLRCYDCDPTFDGKCITPEADNVKITACEDDSTARIPESYLKRTIQDIDNLDIKPRVTDTSELEYECFSLYYETDEEGENHGVYRGCIEKVQEIASSCSYLSERLNKGNITCQTCAGDKCNTQYVGGAAALTVSLGIVIVNLVLCLKIFTF